MTFSFYLKRRTLSFLALAIPGFFLAACNSKPNLVYGPNTFHVDESKVTAVKIDPAEAKTDEMTSAIMDSVEYLPLETTPKSMFGDITQLEVTDDKYIIWDQVSNAILFFDKSGKFLTKISNKDNGAPVPYKKIVHFALDKKNNELVFMDRHSMLEYHYDLNGKFLRSVNKPVFIEPQYTILGKNKIFWQSYNYEKMAHADLPSCNIIIEDDKGNKKFYFPFDSTAVQYLDMKGVQQSFFTSHNGIINLTVPYDYGVYSIDTIGKVRKIFQIIMPDAITVPDDFMTNSRYKGKRLKYTDSNNEVIYGITDFYQSGDNIFFLLYGHGYSQILTYNLTSKKLRSLINYVSDKMTYMLPVIQNSIYGIDEKGRVISGVSASNLFTAKLKRAGMTEWEASLPEKLKKFYESNNQQNPVLTIMAFKQHI